jgi:hypothetical protein
VQWPSQEAIILVSDYLGLALLPHDEVLDLGGEPHLALPEGPTVGMLLVQVAWCTLAAFDGTQSVFGLGRKYSLYGHEKTDSRSMAAGLGFLLVGLVAATRFPSAHVVATASPHVSHANHAAQAASSAGLPPVHAAAWGASMANAHHAEVEADYHRAVATTIASDSVQSAAHVAAIAEFGYTGYNFLLLNQPLSWQGAEAACNDRNGQLATVQSKDMLHYLATALPQQGCTATEAWFGWQWPRGSQRWSWIDGSPSKYVNWSPHIDKVPSQRCGSLITVGGSLFYNDQPCKTQMQCSVCQISWPR